MVIDLTAANYNYKLPIEDMEKGIVLPSSHMI